MATPLTINVGLGNSALYEGMEITEAGGRLALVTSPAEAAPLLAERAVQAWQGAGKPPVVLTGPMAVWAYLAIAGALQKAGASISYADGRGLELAL